MPMVSSEHNGVREGSVLMFYRGSGLGRTATHARNMPSGRVVGYSGHAYLCPAA